MAALISETPRDGFLLKWVDQDVAEFIEALPRYGEGRITIVNGRPEGNFRIVETFLYSRRRRQRKDDV